MRLLSLSFGLFLLAGCPSSVLVGGSEDDGVADGGLVDADGGPSDGGPGSDARSPATDASFHTADAAPAMDAAPTADAAAPEPEPGPWAETDCEWADPLPALPEPDRVLPNGFSAWRGPFLRAELGRRRLRVDGEGRLHLVEVRKSGDVVHAHGVPGHWQPQTIHRSPAVEDVRSAEVTLVRGQPHIGYSSAVAEHPTWAYRPCERNDWRIESTPFLVTTNNVGQPGIAFDAATGHLHAVGTTVAYVPDWEETPLGATTLPSTTAPAATPAIVSNWVAYSVQSVADSGHLHVLTSDDGGRRAFHSRDPRGRWHTHEFHGGEAQIVLGDGVLHVVTARRLEWRPGADKELVLLSMDLATHDVRETTLPLEATRWDTLDAAAGPRGELHLVIDAGFGPTYATNRSGDWTASRLDPETSFQSRPAIAVDRTGRPWIAYGNYDSHWLVAGPG